MSPAECFRASDVSDTVWIPRNVFSVELGTVNRGSFFPRDCLGRGKCPDGREERRERERNSSQSHPNGLVGVSGEEGGRKGQWCAHGENIMSESCNLL